MKDKLKTILLNVGITGLVAIGIVYATDITTTTQTVAPNDVIKAEWFNAVNARLNTVGAASSNTWQCHALTTSAWSQVCVNPTCGTICSYAETSNTSGQIWSAWNCRAPQSYSAYYTSWQYNTPIQSVSPIMAVGMYNTPTCLY